MDQDLSREEEICFLIKRIANRFNRFQDQGKAAPGILGAGFMLSVLAGRKEVNQRELIGMAQIRSASVSEILQKLEREGLIRRRKDPRDRRNTLVSLTPRGLQKETEITLRRREVAREMLDPLSEEEQEQLHALLAKTVMAYLSGEKEPAEGGSPPAIP